MHRYILFVFLYLIFIESTFADDMVMKNGMLLKCTIISSLKDSINVQTDTGSKMIAKSDILSIVFTNADHLFVVGDNKIVCKIVNKIGDDVIIVTKDGIRKISNSKIDKLQRNIGAELTVSELPETGIQFINHPTQSVWTGEQKANIFLRVQLAAHYASLDKWKSQFVITDGEGSPSSGIMYGGEIGYAFSKIIQIGAGYEGFNTRKISITNTSPTFETKASYSYLYATVRAGDFLGSTPELYLYGAVDLGSLKGIDAENYSNGLSPEGTGTAIAFRVKGGAEYYFNGNWSTTAELGYLSAKVQDVSVVGQHISNFDLDFSGLSLVIAFSYHIPLN
ncbi:MAG: outer membrane beta-barrel protein [Bacteroidota bacterium]